MYVHMHAHGLELSAFHTDQAASSIWKRALRASGEPALSTPEPVSDTAIMHRGVPSGYTSCDTVRCTLPRRRARQCGVFRWIRGVSGGYEKCIRVH